MTNQDNIKDLYNDFISQGVYTSEEIGDEETFRQNFENEESARQLYKDIISEGYYTSEHLGSEDEWVNSYAMKQPATQEDIHEVADVPNEGASDKPADTNQQVVTEAHPIDAVKEAVGETVNKGVQYVKNAANNARRVFSGNDYPRHISGYPDVKTRILTSVDENGNRKQELVYLVGEDENGMQVYYKQNQVGNDGTITGEPQKTALDTSNPRKQRMDAVMVYVYQYMDDGHTREDIYNFAEKSIRNQTGSIETNHDEDDYVVEQVKALIDDRLSAEAMENILDPLIKEQISAADVTHNAEIDKLMEPARPSNVPLSRDWFDKPERFYQIFVGGVSRGLNSGTYSKKIEDAAKSYGVSKDEYVKKYIMPQLAAMEQIAFESYQIEKNTPKNMWEYMSQSIKTSSIPGMIYGWLTTDSEKRKYEAMGLSRVEQRAGKTIEAIDKDPYMTADEKEYWKGECKNVNNVGEIGRLLGFGASFLADTPFFGISGKVSGATVRLLAKRQVSSIAERLLLEGAGKAYAERQAMKYAGKRALEVAEQAEKEYCKAAAQRFVQMQLKSAFGKQISDTGIKLLAGATNFGTYEGIHETVSGLTGAWEQRATGVDEQGNAVYEWIPKSFSVSDVIGRTITGAVKGAFLAGIGELPGLGKLTDEAIGKWGNSWLKAMSSKEWSGKAKNVLDSVSHLVTEAMGFTAMGEIEKAVSGQIQEIDLTRDYEESLAELLVMKGTGIMSNPAKTKERISQIWQGKEPWFSADDRRRMSESKTGLQFMNSLAYVLNGGGKPEDGIVLAKALDAYVKDPSTLYKDRVKACLIAGITPPDKPAATGCTIEGVMSADGEKVEKYVVTTIDAEGRGIESGEFKTREEAEAWKAKYEDYFRASQLTEASKDADSIKKLNEAANSVIDYDRGWTHAYIKRVLEGEVNDPMLLDVLLNKQKELVEREKLEIQQRTEEIVKRMKAERGIQEEEATEEDNEGAEEPEVAEEAVGSVEEKQPGQPEQPLTRAQTHTKRGRDIITNKDAAGARELKTDIVLALMRADRLFREETANGKVKQNIEIMLENGQYENAYRYLAFEGRQMSKEQREALLQYIDANVAYGSAQQQIEQIVEDTKMQHATALQKVINDKGIMTAITVDTPNGQMQGYAKTADLANEYGLVTIVTVNADGTMSEAQSVGHNAIKAVGNDFSIDDHLKGVTERQREALQAVWTDRFAGTTFAQGETIRMNFGGAVTEAVVMGRENGKILIQDPQSGKMVPMDETLVRTAVENYYNLEAEQRLQKELQAAQDNRAAQLLKEKQERFARDIYGYADENIKLLHPDTKSKAAAEWILDRNEGNRQKSINQMENEKARLISKYERTMMEMRSEYDWLEMNEDADEATKAEHKKRHAELDALTNEIEAQVRKVNEIRYELMDEEMRNAMSRERRNDYLKAKDTATKKIQKVNVEVGVQRNAEGLPVDGKELRLGLVERQKAKDVLLDECKEMSDAAERIDSRMKKIRKDWDKLTSIQARNAHRLTDYQSGYEDMTTEELELMAESDLRAQAQMEVLKQEMAGLKALEKGLENLYAERNALLYADDPAGARMNRIHSKKTPQARYNQAVKEYTEGLAHDIINDLEPQTLEEWVSQIGAGSINWEGYDVGEHHVRGLQEELGRNMQRTMPGQRGKGDTYAFDYMLAKKGEGQGIDELIHSMWENRPKQFDEVTTEDIRNAILQTLMSARTPEDLRDRIINDRMERAEEAQREMERMNEPGEDIVYDDLNNEDVVFDENFEDPFSGDAYSNEEMYSLNTEGKRRGGLLQNETGDQLDEAERELLNKICNSVGVTAQVITPEKALELFPGKFKDVDDVRRNFNGANLDGVVYLNAERLNGRGAAEAARFIIGHEITHTARRGQGEEWKSFVQAVKATMGEEAFEAALEEKREGYFEKYVWSKYGKNWDELSAEEKLEIVSQFEKDLYEEVCADWAGDYMFRSREDIETFLKNVEENGYDSADIAKEAIKNIDATVRELNIEEETSTTRIGQLLIEQGKLMQTRSMWSELYKGAVARQNEGIAQQTGEQSMKASLRLKPAPEKTVKVYKLMRLGEDKKLYPLFIDAASPTQIGMWYDADAPDLSMLRPLESGVWLVDPKTREVESYEDFYRKHPELFKNGMPKLPTKEAVNWATDNGMRFMFIEDTERAQRRFDGENRKYWNVGINGSGTVSTFSSRPGWHAASHPSMRQIGKGKAKNLRDDSFVWVEGEISADMDYNAEVQQNPDKDMPDRIPTDGFYLKATNADAAKSQADRIGWYVAGAFKVNRVMSDWEARKVIDDWNAEHPDRAIEYDYERESGKEFNAETMELEDRQPSMGDGEVKSDTGTRSYFRLIPHKFENPLSYNDKQTAECADEVFEQMEKNAEPMRHLVFSKEVYDREFPEGKVITPIGTVKIGESQYAKFENKDKGKRSERFGMAAPTLMRPDIILKKDAPKENAERQTKYLFVKSFLDKNNNKVYHFESVTVQQDGNEVSISSHDIDARKVRSELRNNNLLWTRFGIESNPSDKSQGLDIQQVITSELAENVPNTQSKLSASEVSENNPNYQTNNEKFSLATQKRDSDYLYAVAKGDKEKAAEFVKEAAKAAMPDTKVVDEKGEPMVVYHGSAEWFTRFDPNAPHHNNVNTPNGAFFFSKLRDNAQSYTFERGNVQLDVSKIGTRMVINRNGEYEDIPDKRGGIYPVYLNLRNPLVVDYKGNNWSGKKTVYKATDWSTGKDYQFDTAEERKAWTDEQEKSGNHNVSWRQYEEKVDGLKETNEYVKEAMESGMYDGVIFKNIEDYGYRPHDVHEITDEYVAFHPEQIKSSEAVTYDDSGNVIPLSERFNPENEDIRFSLNIEKKDPFYSNAAKAVEDIKQEKATPEQWLKMIEKAGGLKKGEDKWMGLSDWLKQKTAEGIVFGQKRPERITLGGEEYDVAELENNLRADVEAILADNGIEDAKIVGVKLVGSYMRGEQREDSDLDLLVEYSGNAREDNLFNIINDAENKININGIDVDVNPITKDKSGSIDEWEKRNAGFSKKPITITKQEVMDFINQNAIKLEEVNYSEAATEFEDDVKGTDEYIGLVEELTEYDEDGNPYIDQDRSREYQKDENFYQGFSVDYWGESLDIDDPTAAARYLRLTDEEPINSTRLEYTTDGLDNKREIAITIPTVEAYKGDLPDIHFYDERTQGKTVVWMRFGDTDVRRTMTQEEIDKVAADIPSADKWTKHDGSQFVSKNDIYTPTAEKPHNTYIVHYNKQGGYSVFVADKLVGASDTLEGAVEQYKKNYALTLGGRKVREKVLVIDEIQSQRHQDARENGYMSDPIDTTGWTAFKNQTFEDGISWYTVRDAEGQFVASLGARTEEDALWKAGEAKKKEAGAVPDAPFDKNWHELAMKRMLRYAAENGYDKVAWTTGAQQAERYDLRKQLDAIEYFKNEDGTYFASYILKGRRDGSIVGTKLTEKELVENFGKEIADKIINGEKTKEREARSMFGDNNRTLSVLEGDNLAIGGEGMKGFYDQMLPKFLAKYGKKWGAKVGEVELPQLGKNDRVMHSVDVTPEMKESVMQGQPMFSLGDKYNLRENYPNRWDEWYEEEEKRMDEWLNHPWIGDKTIESLTIAALNEEKVLNASNIGYVLYNLHDEQTRKDGDASHASPLFKQDDWGNVPTEDLKALAGKKLPYLKSYRDEAAKLLYACTDMESKQAVVNRLIELDYSIDYYQNMQNETVEAENGGAEAQSWRRWADPMFSLVGQRGAINLDKAGKTLYESIGDDSIRDLIENSKEDRRDNTYNLVLAEDLEQRGYDAEQIKWMTGWERGKDGKWRMEMKDLEIRFDKSRDGKTIWDIMEHDLTLGDIISNDNALFTAYPELKDVHVDDKTVGGESGAYNAERNTINLAMDDIANIRISVEYWKDKAEKLAKNDPTVLAEAENRDFSPSEYERLINTRLATYTDMLNELKAKVTRTLAHEVQHYIQGVEGFARGGSPKAKVDATTIINNMTEAEYDIFAEAVQKKDFNKANEVFAKKAKKMGMSDSFAKETVLGYEGYRHLAGEVEARAVAARNILKAEERLGSLVSADEDINRDEQMVRFSIDTTIAANREVWEKARKEEDRDKVIYMEYGGGKYISFGKDARRIADAAFGGNFEREGGATLFNAGDIFKAEAVLGDNLVRKEQEDYEDWSDALKDGIWDSNRYTRSNIKQALKEHPALAYLRSEVKQAQKDFKAGKVSWQEISSALDDYIETLDGMLNGEREDITVLKGARPAMLEAISEANELKDAVVASEGKTPIRFAVDQKKASKKAPARKTTKTSAGQKTQKEWQKTAPSDEDIIDTIRSGQGDESTGEYYEGDNQELAHAVKRGENGAIREAARRMTLDIANMGDEAKEQNREMCVYVPIPSHTGKATYTLGLAKEMSRITGIPVVDVLEGDPRESLYEKRAAGEDMDVVFRVNGDIPEGKIVILIDNVSKTGKTIRAAEEAINDTDVEVGSIISSVLAEDHSKTLPVGKNFVNLSGEEALRAGWQRITLPEMSAVRGQEKSKTWKEWYQIGLDDADTVDDLQGWLDYFPTGGRVELEDMVDKESAEERNEAVEAWIQAFRDTLSGNRTNHEGSIAQPWENVKTATIHSSNIRNRMPQLHEAAKHGDVKAACDIVSSCVKRTEIAREHVLHPDALVVALKAEDMTGRNQLPIAFAHEFEKAGFDVDTEIVQTNRAFHTDASKFDRLMSRARFDGNVEAGREYIIVDDYITSGATIRDLKDYIESKGGKVVAVHALNGSAGAKNLELTEETYNKLINNGITERQIQELGLSQTLKNLTEGEARELEILSRRGRDFRTKEQLQRGSGRTQKARLRKQEQNARAAAAGNDAEGTDIEREKSRFIEIFGEELDRRLKGLPAEDVAEGINEHVIEEANKPAEKPAEAPVYVDAPGSQQTSLFPTPYTANGQQIMSSRPNPLQKPDSLNEDLVEYAKAMKKWNENKDISGEQIKWALGKPRKRKSETDFEYAMRVAAWQEQGDNINSAGEEPRRNTFMDQGDADFQSAMAAWKQRHGITGDIDATMPRRNEGEDDFAYMARIREWENAQDAIKDMDDPMPSSLEFMAEAERKYKDAYTAWKQTSDRKEQQNTDIAIYNGTLGVDPFNDGPVEQIEPGTITDEAAEVRDNQRVLMEMGIKAGFDGTARGARRAAKIAVIERRKNLESACAEDAIFLNGRDGLKNKIGKAAKELGMKEKELDARLPFLIEARTELASIITDVYNTLAGGFLNHYDVKRLLDPIMTGNYEGLEPTDVRMIEDIRRVMDDYENGNDRKRNDTTLTNEQRISADKLYNEMRQARADYELSKEPEVGAILDEVRDWYEDFYLLLENHGLKHEDTGHVTDYVNHVWDKAKSDKDAFDNFQRTTSGNMKKRQAETYRQGIALGLAPRYETLTEMMAHYSRQNNEAIANRQMLDTLSGLTVNEVNSDGEIVEVMPVMSSKEPETFNKDRYVRYEVPGVGNVWVLKEVQPWFASIFGTQRTQDAAGWMTKAGRVYDLTASTMKKIQLGLSGFHALALTEVALVQKNPLKGMQDLLKYTFYDSLTKGATPAMAHPEDFHDAASHLVNLGATQDYAAADVQAMTGRIKQLADDMYAKSKAVGAVPDAVATLLDWTNKGIDTVLWTYIHDGLKIAAFRGYANKLRKQAEREGWDKQKLDHMLDEAGQYVNDTFGGQYWEVLGVSPTTLKWMRRAFLSPDWLVSTSRHAFSMTGFGSLYSEKDFGEYIKNVYQWNSEKDKEAAGRAFRAKGAWKCYAVLVPAFYYSLMNVINAYVRANDEEDEREKAEEMRKTNPEYKSAYELKYPDGMKWYDYTMYGNGIGQQTHLFFGRNEDGTENYVRWGKQFREIPEFFMGRYGGVEFPTPLFDRLIGKSNPVLGTLLDNLRYFGVSGMNQTYEQKDLQEKYGKTIGALAMNARHFVPFSIPTSENQEFHWIDLIMPSQKGFSKSKALNYFQKFIEAGDMDGVTAVVNACNMNGIDGEKQLQAAIATVKAQQRKETEDGIVDLATAMEAYDQCTSVKERKHLRAKILAYQTEDQYHAFKADEAIKKVQDALNGVEDDKETNDKYIRLTTAEDVRDENRVKIASKALKEYSDRLKELKTAGKANEAKEYAQAHADKIRAIELIKKYNSSINKIKKTLGKGNDVEAMDKIRNLRRECLQKIDKS